MGIFNIFKKHAAPADADQKTAPTAATAKKSPPAEAAAPATPASAPRASPRTILPNILVRRLITEKAGNQEKLRQYTFVVSPAANKITIAEAVRQRYGVHPVAVRISNHPGRLVRFGRRQGRTKAWKKAIVTLPEGAKIESGKSAS